MPAARKTLPKSTLPLGNRGRFPGRFSSGGKVGPASFEYLAINSSVEGGWEGSSLTTNQPSTVEPKPFRSFIGGTLWEAKGGSNETKSTAGPACRRPGGTIPRFSISGRRQWPLGGCEGAPDARGGIPSLRPPVSGSHRGRRLAPLQTPKLSFAPHPSPSHPHR